MSSVHSQTNIKSSKYIVSAPDLEHCPVSDLPEIAFIGRSNVGKSSLINLLCNNKNLALTSKVPGKTKLINFFLINSSWHLVDLPGYGYAKTSRDKREAWLDIAESYFLNRTNLKAIFALIDSNLPPQESDLEFINWLSENELDFIIVFTKSDKSPQREINYNTKTFLDTITQITGNKPISFIVSIEKKPSKDKLLEYLKGVFEAN